MPQETDDGTDEETGGSLIPGVSRRKALTIVGAGAGLTALGGASTVVGQQDGDGDGDGTPTETPTGTETATGDGGSVFDDLVDPVFGYPLSADETDTVDLEHVVDVTFEDGQGSHEEFPSEPDEDAPGQFVEIPAEFFFDPVGVHVEPGDLVHFDLSAGLHTITAFHEKFSDPHLDVPTRVPEGVPGFTSPPVTPGESWIYEFTESGVYDLFCFPHLGLGMVMRVVAFDPEEDAIEDDTFDVPPPDQLFPNDERVLEAEQLDPGNIVDAGTVAWEDLSLGTPTPTATATETETETETEGS